MSYITTYTGITFYPEEPNMADIKIEDIAHSLSLLCRANGHFKEFFSVAQHCVNCAMEAKARGYSKIVQLACLLHDGSESYLSDVTRPVKAQLPKYREIEQTLQEMIYHKFLDKPLTEEECFLVNSVDDAMLFAEFSHFMGKNVFDKAPEVISNPDFMYADFKAVEKAFLKEFIKF